jgi:alkyl sulfatase BDS1-like metallo-beta-lactamase superfamily hydrolase
MNRALEIAADNPETLIQDAPVADVLYSDRYDIQLGGLDVQIINVPGGETVDSALIWLPQHKILFSGNTFGPLFPHFPNINTIRGDKYRHLEPYMEAINSARAFKAEVLITGHFDPIVGAKLIDDSLLRLHDAAQYVYRTTLDKMNLGKDVYELMDTIALPSELKVGEGYGQVKWAVRTIWEAYMGWFKGQETSELFSTRPQAIYAELVDMAGVEAVIEKGREKLNAGEAAQGQLYAEACLAAAPENTLALQLSIDAHQALKQLRTEKNFWEDGWLDSCCEEMQARLDALKLKCKNTDEVNGNA